MHDLYRYSTPLSKKGDMFYQSDWKLRNREFTEDDIRVATKYSLIQSTQDDMEDKDQDCRYFPNE